MITLGKALADRTADIKDARAAIYHARMMRRLGFAPAAVAMAQYEARLSVGLVSLSSRIASQVAATVTLCPCKSADQCGCVPPF